MRLRYRIFISAVLLPLVLLTAGCAGPGQHRAWREKAEQHLAQLQRKVGEADHFALQAEKPDAPDKAAEIIFKVSSETYGDSFRLYVSRDASSCTDDYYSLYLKAEAEERVQTVLSEVLGNGFDQKPAVSFQAVSGYPDLSLHGAEKLDDLLQKTLPSTCMNVKLIYPGTENLSEAAVDQLLLAMQAEGLYCRFYPYISSALSYFIRNDSFSQMKQTGADAGAMWQLQDYVPTLSDKDMSPAQ